MPTLWEGFDRTAAELVLRSLTEAREPTDEASLDVETRRRSLHRLALDSIAKRTEHLGVRGFRRFHQGREGLHRIADSLTIPEALIQARLKLVREGEHRLNDRSPALHRGV